jgi:DNA-binding LytR/AlgR family response regulator
MNKLINQWVRLINHELKLFFWVSVGVFLFILFFQPFPLDNFDFNNRLLFVAGMAGIVFFLMVLLRTLFPYEGLPDEHLQSLHQTPAILSSSVLLALISVAFAFYIRYVGGVPITFFIMFKVVFIALFPPVAIKLQNRFNELKLQNDNLRAERQINQQQLENMKEEYLNKQIHFTSETSGDDLRLLLSEIVFIKSANNYVEIVFKEGDEFEKKLLRNTLKTIEAQLKPYPVFIRCHRICIINSHHIQKLENRNQNYWISIKGFPEPIPVSRQYLMKVKDSL